VLFVKGSGRGVRKDDGETVGGREHDASSCGPLARENSVDDSAFAYSTYYDDDYVKRR
jgi:hypothetical protein